MIISSESCSPARLGTTDNPARWELLKHSLPARRGARTAGHFRALAYSDMPALLKDLAADASISALCMRFTILTVARTKESTACRWPDVDFAAVRAWCRS